MDELARKVDEEIRGGLRCGKADRDAARVAINYYELRGQQYIQRRDAESYQDFMRRPKRSLPFTRRVIDLLCSHLYNPGPSRQIEDETLNAWYAGVIADNLLGSLWQAADRYATLNGLSLFQAGWTGDPAHPIKVHLWTRDEFELFTKPDDSTAVAHVVTIERIDETTVYKWWSQDKVRTYKSKKLGLYQTTAGQTAEFDSEEPNPYGILPFSLVHYTLPVRSVQTSGLGNYLAEINGGLDEEASDMAAAVKAYHTPLGILYDGSAEQQVIKKVGSFVRVNTDNQSFETANKSRLEYLQAQLDIEGGWHNIRTAIDTVLDGLGVPQSSYRMNQSTLPSGVAQIAEQAPLVDYSKARQEPYRKYETDFLRMVLKVAGYDDPESVAMSLKWPPQQITLPGSERDDHDRDSMALGLESLVMVAMRRFGLTEVEALAHLQKVSDQNRQVESMGLDRQSLNPSPFGGDPDNPDAPKKDGDGGEQVDE